MFKPKLLAALTASIVVLAATSAFAQEASPAPELDNFVSAKARAEVRVETRHAMRGGLVPRNDWEVQRIADQGFRSLMTRAQVRAEAVEAIRLGLVSYGETSAPQATPEQLEQIRLAGLRALQADRTVAGK